MHVICKSEAQLEKEGWTIKKAGRFVHVTNDAYEECFIVETYEAVFLDGLPSKVYDYKKKRHHIGKCLSPATGKRFTLNQELVSHAID